LPAGPQSFGQAPPYLAGTQLFPAGLGWYTFLPVVGHYHLKSLTLEDDRVVVELPPGPVMTFDIRTGVPLDEQYRGGLSAEEWEARQTDLLRVLFDAAGFDQSDAHAEGAALLEEFAAVGSGSPQQLSVPLYRAALMRMRAGGLTGRDEYAAALTDITAALEHERDPPRYRLLRAELFTRLQQRQQVAELIREWGHQPESPSYAFEWYLLDRLAGLPVRPERFLERWAGEMDNSGWGLAIRMLEAWLSGRYDQVERLLESFHVQEQTWAVHHYWAARAALDRQPAEPARALDHLRRAAELPGVGLALPLATTRLRAELLLDTANGDARRLEPALKELDALLLSAASELSAFFMLPIAESEMAEVAATLGMPELARRFRERSASRAPSVVID